MIVDQRFMLGIDLDAQSAVISPCGAYRYRLSRRWGAGPAVLFIMLNPSKADALKDDPTIRRCVGFSRRWGFGALAVGNLFALRSTDPKALYSATDPVGPENDDHLRVMVAESGLIVAAWGVHGSFARRSAAVRGMFPELKVLGLTKGGEPLHPLYLSAHLTPREWEAGS